MFRRLFSCGVVFQCREEKQKEAAARKREKRRQKKKQQKSNNNTSNANSQEQETNEHNKDSQEEDANDSKDADSIPVKSSAEEQETELQRSGGSSGKGGLSSSGRKSRIVRGDGITSDLEPKDEVDDETGKFVNFWKEKILASIRVTILI